MKNMSDLFCEKEKCENKLPRKCLSRHSVHCSCIVQFYSPQKFIAAKLSMKT